MDKKTIIIASVVTVVCLGILCCLVPIEQKRQLHEKWGELAVLAETDDRAQFIIDNEELYPQEILSYYYDYDNCFDFVYNYPFIYGKYPVIEFTDEELNCTEIPAISMEDPRWCYDPIDGGYIFFDGCAAVSLTMANLYLNHNDAVDPRKVSDYATENGCTALLGGIIVDKLPIVFDHFNIGYTEHIYDSATGNPITEDELKSLLDKDDTVVFACLSGDVFGDHAIIICDYDDNGFKINDPSYLNDVKKTVDYGVLSNEIFTIYELYTK